MNKLNIETKKVEKTKIAVRDIEDGILLIISGEIDMRDPSSLILPHLINIHDTTVAKKIKNISLDFTNLNYVNSSGIKMIISWLMKSKDVPADHGYKVRIIQDSDIAWQESTFPVIMKLFPELVTIAEE